MFRNSNNRSAGTVPTTGGSLAGTEELVADGAGRPAGEAVAGRRGADGPEDGVRLRIPVWKRCLDLTCVILTLPLWSVAIGVIAVWIKLVSRGPVFFRQTRIGLGGRPFTLWKLRSMHAGTDQQAHLRHVDALMATDAPMEKLDETGDPRLIRGGRWLRALGADELPQILNVLAGEMSLVGPRPCLPEEYERYQPWQKARFLAPPGLTGYWQVNGKNRTTFSQMIEMDIEYARKMSLLFDLVILLGTIPSVLLTFVESRSRIRHRLPANCPETGIPCQLNGMESPN